MGQDKINELKKQAEQLAAALGYNTNVLSFDLINVCDAYCRGYQKCDTENTQLKEQLSLCEVKLSQTQRLLGSCETALCERDTQLSTLQQQMNDSLKLYESQNNTILKLEQRNNALVDALERIWRMNAAPSMDILINRLQNIAREAINANTIK